MSDDNTADVLGVGNTAGLGVAWTDNAPAPAGDLGPFAVSIYDSNNTVTIPVPRVGANEKGK